MPGAIIGGLIIGVGETVGSQMIAPSYMDSIAFVVMILILLVRPTGLMSKGGR